MVQWLRHILLKSAVGWLVATMVLPLQLLGEDFKEYEIRVIRPKYFQKKGRVEFGAQAVVVTNQTFIYTYLASGILDFHFTEQLAIEAAGAYGFSFDKQDKTTLKDNFKIATTILRTKYFLEGSLLYTPMYGKYQLSSGKVIYFDTFLSLGGGMTGVEYLYDHCKDPTDVGQQPSDSFPSPPAPRVVSYPGGVFGIGQRFFIDKKRSIRWDIKDHIFMYNKADGSCNPSTAEAGSAPHQNLTLQLGMSYFF